MKTYLDSPDSMSAMQQISSAKTQLEKPYEPSIYHHDSDIPFAPDGNAPLICTSIEKVKGINGHFRGIKCVRKTIVIDSETDSGTQMSLIRTLVQEAKILYLARHRHVVKLVHTYIEQIEEDQMKYVVIMDRADTSLATFLRPEKRPALRWFGCLINAVCHIHTLGIRHRDIKPSNILVKGEKILLADFGISQMGLGRTFPTTYQYRNASRTRQYCAPEVDQGSTRGRSADIFSLGAVFLEMLVSLNDLKFSKELGLILKPSPGSVASYAKHIHEVLQWINTSFHPSAWQGEFLLTCQKMLDPERDTRPSAEEIERAWSSVIFTDTSMSCHCDQDAEINWSEQLINACKKGSMEDIDRLLNQCTVQDNSEVIHFAAARGSAAIVQNLLARGVDVNAVNLAGQTALHCASRNGSEDVIRALLNNGANVNAQDEHLQTALHGAAAQGHEGIVRILLGVNADSLAKNVDGWTALHFAAKGHHSSIVDILKEHSIN